MLKRMIKRDDSIVGASRRKVPEMLDDPWRRDVLSFQGIYARGLRVLMKRD